MNAFSPALYPIAFGSCTPRAFVIILPEASRFISGSFLAAIDASILPSGLFGLIYPPGPPSSPGRGVLLSLAAASCALAVAISFLFLCACACAAGEILNDPSGLIDGPPGLYVDDTFPAFGPGGVPFGFGCGVDEAVGLCADGADPVDLGLDELEDGLVF